MARKIQILKNPQVGLYSVRYRDSKGRFTKALSKASSFQYVLKNGSLSRTYKIPPENKKVAEKNLYIKERLYKLYKSYYDRRNREEKRKKEEAREKGQAYQGKTIAPMEQAIGVSKEERGKLEERGLEIDRGDYIYRINREELDKRRKQGRAFIKKLLEDKKIEDFYLLPAIIARTDGSPTPLDKDFQYLKNKKGKNIDWYQHQLATGLISKNDQQSSIMLNIVRNLKQFFVKDFKFLKDSIMTSPFRILTNVIVHIGSVTDVEEHENVLYDEDNFVQFDLRDNLKNTADSVSFKIAAALMQLINRDIESMNDVNNSLTSEEKFTVIKSPGKKDQKEEAQKFRILPFITLKFTRSPREKKS
jgi:uncharacterized membrane protein YkoI